MGFQAENLWRVLERIDSAAQGAGRDAGSIALLAVSKTLGPDQIRAAHDTGLRLFGENRVQEGVQKVAATGDLPGIQWHFIGHLQKNKVRPVLQHFHLIHSVDSLDLARRIDRLAGSMGRRAPILLQVHLGDEPTKHGLEEGELDRSVAEIRCLEHLSLRGLMAIPPYSPDQEKTRPHFRRLRHLRDRLAAGEAGGLEEFGELSMGMSHDLEVAVEEGATIIRVGTAIFGKRTA